MAIALANSSTASSGTSYVTSITHTFGFTATANNLLLLWQVVTRANNSARIPSVPSGWTDVASTGWQFRGQGRLVYKIADGTESSETVAVASGDGSLGSIVAEYSGIDTTTPLDTSGTGGAFTGTSLTLSTAATTNDDALIFFGFFLHDQTITTFSTLTSGYTEQEFFNSSSHHNRSYNATDRIITASETPSATMTWPSNDVNGGVMAVFNAAAGGGGSPTHPAIRRNLTVPHLAGRILTPGPFAGTSILKKAA